MAKRAIERATAARRRALVSNPEIQATLAQALPPPEPLVQWLAQLLTLAPVPFAPLVVNAAMLPAESLRFFYVDPNWLGALFDGAVSVGRGVPKQSVATGKAMQQLKQDAFAKAKYGSAPALGFLLRSGVIAAYPKLVIRGYADANGTTRVYPLRLQSLGANFMIGIFPQPLQRLDIQEPPEGMQFGFEPENGALVLTLRTLDGSHPGSEIKPAVQVPIQLRTGGERVVDIAGLQATLQGKLAPSGGLGPADFAVQLVAAPETQRFLLQQKQQQPQQQPQPPR